MSPERGNSLPLRERSVVFGSRGSERNAFVFRRDLPLAAGEETDTEEERRLFYVGITRAKEELILTTSGEPSPFLSAIAGLKRERSVPKTEYRQLALF